MPHRSPPPSTHDLTVGDLRKLLQELPDNARVVAFGHFGEEHPYSRFNVRAGDKMLVIDALDLGPEPD
jgi:hypothetical protein